MENTVSIVDDVAAVHSIVRYAEMCLPSLETDCITPLIYCCLAQTTQKTRVTCQTASSLVRYQHWAWHGLHRKHNYYCRVLLLPRNGSIRHNIETKFRSTYLN
jgi:hypothetical protein